MSENQTQPTYLSALIVTVCVFFFWGFAASGNALLIPVFKETFNLSQFQSQLVELSFYMAYFVGSLIYFIISVKKSTWLERMGSKKVMISGLIISAIGTILLVIASGFHSYIFFLLSLFTVALGFAFQQIIANPLLIKLGGSQYGAHRLILAGGVNSFGNTIAPLVLSIFLFGTVANQDAQIPFEPVRILFITLAILYLLFAFWFYKTPLPPVDNTLIKSVDDTHGALKYPQLILGMIAIFCYVGSEVSIQSNLPALVASSRIMNLPAKDAIHYFSLFGGGLLIGRWTGAIFNFKLSKIMRVVLLFIVPSIAFATVLFVNYLHGSNLSEIIDFAPFILTLIIVLLISKDTPERMLLLSSIAAGVLLITSFLFTGKVAMYCVISASFFCALMWPCIFILAIRGLGKYTQKGSSLLIMMILGGAIIPPLQGLLSDNPDIGIHFSYIVPVICFAYLAWFSIKMMARKAEEI